MEFVSAAAEGRYAALVRAAAESIVGLDFDGTLSPIVDDPEQAHIHPGAADVLVALAAQVRAVAVVTGRPARQALDLGGLEEVADAVHASGKDLYVFGQYGNERWSSDQRRIVSPRPPAGLATFERELPRVLREGDAADAWIEDKGLAVAVHTRRLPDPTAAFERLQGPVGDLARAHGLVVEPGRHVLEVRSPGMHKGQAVDTLVRLTGAAGFLFVGDDLGDVEAFEAVSAHGRSGAATLLVAVATEEQQALVERADVLVSGPDEVLELLRAFTADAKALRA